MLRLLFWLSCSCCVFMQAVFGLQLDQEKSNVIIYLTDDFPGGLLTDESIYIPNIQELKNKGKVLNYSYSATAVCMPSRIALLMGRTLGSIPVWGNVYPVASRWPMRKTPITIASTLLKMNYTTGMVGKWQLLNGQSPDNIWHHPVTYGFQYVRGLLGLVSYTPYTLTACDSTSSSPIIDMNCTEIIYPENLNRTKIKDKELECFDAFGNQTLDNLGKCIYSEDIFHNESIKFLETARLPFFLLWAPYAPHSQKDSRKLEYLVPRISDRYRNKTDWDINRKSLASLITDYIDKDIGAIQNVLKYRGIENNTLIIFISDNGGAIHEFNILRGGKGALFEGGIRSTSIVSWPGRIPFQTTSMFPTAHYDIALTILEAINAPEDIQEPFKRFRNLSGAPVSVYKDWIANSTAPNHELQRDGLFFKYCSLHICSTAFIEASEIPYSLWKIQSDRSLIELYSNPFEVNATYRKPIKVYERLLTKLQRSEICFATIAPTIATTYAPVELNASESINSISRKNKSKHNNKKKKKKNPCLSLYED